MPTQSITDIPRPAHDPRWQEKYAPLIATAKQAVLQVRVPAV